MGDGIPAGRPDLSRVALAEALLFEEVEDGALIFDPNTGATTLSSGLGLAMIKSLRSLGALDEAALRAAVQGMGEVAENFTDTLVLLEKSQLIFRC